MFHAKAFAGLALASAIGLLDGAHAAVWHVPLERHTSGHTPIADAHRRLAYSKKASVWTPGFRADDLARDHTSSRGGIVPVDFRDIRSGLFAAKLSIGTPPQPVSLVLDMGSSDILVINQAIENHLYYDHNKSSTYHANGTRVVLGEGEPYEVDGFVSSDHVTLGSVDGTSRIEVHDQLFVEMTGPQTFLRALPSKLDGFIGIGPGRANSTSAPSIVRSMVDQQLLERPQVGLRYEEVVGHAVFGGVEAAYSHDDFHYYAQQHTGMWSAPVRAVKVAGKQVLGNIGSAVVSNADILAGPGDQVDALAEAVGAENHALPCDGPGPDITFELADGFPVTLTKDDYAIPQGQGWCMFAIFPTSRPEWALGLPFLRKVYTVLDYGASESEQRIGFAPIKS